MNFVVAIDVVNIHHSLVFQSIILEMVLFEEFNVDVKFNDAIDVLHIYKLTILIRGNSQANRNTILESLIKVGHS
ncbi:MAG: hypothetical protein IPO48_13130 [Saprospiraceae bacterium]|nr:hypothetical protein [Saprospiraceae bacterium]